MSRSRSTIVGGFLLPSAIFLLVILAALGAFIVNIFSAQQLGMALDVNGERAWQAANAGMEWARYKLAKTPGSCPAGTTYDGSTFSLGFPGTSTLTGFSATVECHLLESTKVQTIDTVVFEVRVTACSPAAAAEPKCPGTPTAVGYVERQMQGLISF
jgi:MSHA biogenesis protein MshP